MENNNNVNIGANNLKLSQPSSNNKIVDKAKELAAKGKTAIGNNQSIFFAVIGIYLLIMIAYFLSKTYRVRNVYQKLNKYDAYLMITDGYLKKTNRSDKLLKDFMVASSFRGYMGKYQFLEYCSFKLLKKVIQSGARFLWLDIYNDSLGEFANAVISNGIEKGNWKLTFNVETFDKICKTIKETAFSSGNVDNPDDPIFLALNLKTNNNIVTLNRMQKTIYKYFRDNLLGPEFSYMRGDVPNIPIKKLMKKVVIFSSAGAEGSNLEEIINYSWDNDENNIRVIDYKSLDKTLTSVDAIKLNPNDVYEYNKTGLTIVIPEESGFFTRNYNPDPYLKSGCQFICMNYQNIDDDMNKYITSYRYSSFKLKTRQR